MLSRTLRFRAKPGAAAYYGIALVGVALCAMVLSRMEKEHAIRTQGVSITAVVQAVQPLEGTNDYLIYHYDIDGKRYEVRELISDRFAASVSSGDRLDIWLLPEQPGDPLVPNRGTTPLWVGLVIGLIFVSGGLFGLTQLRRR